MAESKGRGWVVLAVLVPFGLGLFILLQRGNQVDDPINGNEGARQGRAGTTGEVTIGGVSRPSTDLKPVARPNDLGDDRPDEFVDPGTVQPIPADANPMVASIAEAYQSNSHPERLTAMIQPKAFDQAQFDEDPEAYLNVVEPGRIWQPAQPGPGVSRLKSVTPRHVTISQGDTTSLRVQAIPRAPVTFTSFDLGAFQNRLTSITVQADGDGVATARFTGTPGTINDVSIIAASPVTSGQARYVITVTPKGQGAKQ